MPLLGHFIIMYMHFALVCMYTLILDSFYLGACMIFNFPFKPNQIFKVTQLGWVGSGWAQKVKNHLVELASKLGSYGRERNFVGYKKHSNRIMEPWRGSTLSKASRPAQQGIQTIIWDIFVTFTHSNIDFHTLFKENIRDLTFKHILSLRFGPRAAPAERLSIVSSPFMVGKIFLLLHRFKKVSSLVAGVDNSW